MEPYPDLNKLHILRYPDPKLREHAHEIAAVDNFLKEMSERMAELMTEAKGVGLAATQVGCSYRLVIVSPPAEERKIEAFINPVIIEKSGKVIDDEGCLSVPGVWARVRRAEKVRVRATRLNGETVEFEAEGTAARMWQHETDHLDGSLFVDRVGPTSKILLRGKLRELEDVYKEVASGKSQKDEKVKIAFAGTPEFAVPSLAALIASRHKVCLVITQPDRPAGRGRHTVPTPVKALAMKHDIPVFQPDSVNQRGAVARLASLSLDAIVVVAFGTILSRRVLRVPKVGWFNIHGSLLPKYRGAAPIAHAILNGERETGITIQRVAHEVDTGAILGQWTVRIGEDETAGQLSARLAALGGEKIAGIMDAVEDDAIGAKPQNDAAATFAPKLTKSDGIILWDASATDIFNRVRAMTPWPGAFTYHMTQTGDIRSRITIFAAKVANETDLIPPAAPAVPGAVVATNDRLIVAAGTGFVSLLRVQPEGRKPMDAAAYLRGHSIQVGDRFRGPA